jgi:hypothetical protein
MAISKLVLPTAASNAARKGAKRVGGTISKGKGSHYVGGQPKKSSKKQRRLNLHLLRAEWEVVIVNLTP